MKKTLLVSRASSGTGFVAGTTAVETGLMEPVKLAVAKSGEVFIAERGGNVRVWKAGALSLAGKLTVFTGAKGGMPDGSDNENGLHGIVLDPDFATNKWLYVHYTPSAGSSMNISRFTVGSDSKLDMASEKILLQIPIQRTTCCHTGGGMEFDLNGNLFITVGNNTQNPTVATAPESYVTENSPNADDQGHSANTNDLRGKVLRIKPKPDGTYEVPDGNLFAKGTDKTKPEIWAMGLRNPYSLALDKYRGWVAWGDIGPDDGLDYSEEWNVFTKPGYAGWPYFVGKNQTFRLTKTASAPTNNSPNNTGLTNLPPAVPAVIAGRQRAAITGPIYHYDGANASRAKLPPHLHKKWLISDWWDGYLEVITLSDNGESVVSRTKLLPNETFKGVLDIKVGPADGALYVVEYGQVGGGLWFANAASTVISKVEYTGSCHPATPIPVAVADRGILRRGALVQGINLGFRRDVELPAAAKGFRLYDARGRQVWEYRRTSHGDAKVSLPADVGNGILRVKYLE
jgi:cytochrome c